MKAATKLETKAERFARDLANLAGFMQSIATERVEPRFTREKPKHLGFGFAHGTVIRVEIWHRGDPKQDPVWDQTTVNGQWTGNRCGAVQAISALAAEYLAREYGIAEVRHA